MRFQALTLCFTVILISMLALKPLAIVIPMKGKTFISRQINEMFHETDFDKREGSSQNDPNNSGSSSQNNPGCGGSNQQHC